MTRLRAAAWTAAIAILLVGASLAARPYFRAASFIVRAAGVGGPVGAWAARGLPAVHEQDLAIDARHGPLRARLYRAVAQPFRAVLVFAGVHPSGLDEPRLVTLARELAQAGLLVVTPELPDLVHLEITPRSVDDIEDSARWLLARTDLAPGGRVGLLGISFSGSLAIVAAGRPSIRDRIVFVFSFGGHGDLPRVLRYLCTGTDEAAREYPDAPPAPPPHDYGVAVVLYGMAASMVPPDQVDGLRRGVAEFVRASALDDADRPRSAPAFASARQLAESMPEPSRALLLEVDDRASHALGARLAPRLDGYGSDRSLSPDRSPVPVAPVYLLHGRDDDVIPAIESVALDAYLRAHGARTRLLVSTLLSHARVGKTPTFGEVWELVRFWGRMFAER